jgi:predicted membrane chloride channel (bestrophin family)
MNCKELAYLLADYLDGSMDPGMRAELAEHIAMCEPCMAFAKTYRTTCRKAAELRDDIEYRIPDEVRDRLASFLAAAARKFPEQMEEYRRQAEQERREKVMAFCRAAVEERLSSMSTLLVETHVAVCPECNEYFVVLRKTHSVLSLPPGEILKHVVRLLESLPPGEEFFLE